MSSPMSESIALVQACLDQTERIVDICARFGISEKTGRKLFARFAVMGSRRSRHARMRRTVNH